MRLSHYNLKNSKSFSLYIFLFQTYCKQSLSLGNISQQDVAKLGKWFRYFVDTHVTTRYIEKIVSL